MFRPAAGTRAYQVRHRSIPLAAQVGARYGRWLVLAEVAPAKAKTRWLCRCECGTVRVVVGHNLSLGASTSCGCGRRGPRDDRYAAARGADDVTHKDAVDKIDALIQEFQATSAADSHAYVAALVQMWTRAQRAYAAIDEDARKAAGAGGARDEGTLVPAQGPDA